MTSMFRVIAAMMFLFCAGFGVLRVEGAGPKVSEKGNKHNLSSYAWSSGILAQDNINPYRADPGSEAGKQICIFCHTPHNANVAGGAPLWNRSFSAVTFSRFSTGTVKIRSITQAQYGQGAQPDGSSKLCLSCHDGSDLNKVLNSANGSITMLKNNIAGRSLFDTNKMKIGHHPISFVYNNSVLTAIGGSSYKLPSGTSASEVKLDKNAKMQCTTCHNAHQNQSDDNACYDNSNTIIRTCGTAFTNMSSRKVVPFWVHQGAAAAAAYQAVCNECHKPLSVQPMPQQFGP